MSFRGGYVDRAMPANQREPFYTGLAEVHRMLISTTGQILPVMASGASEHAMVEKSRHLSLSRQSPKVCPREGTI